MLRRSLMFDIPKLAKNSAIYYNNSCKVTDFYLNYVFKQYHCLSKSVTNANSNFSTPHINCINISKRYTQIPPSHNILYYVLKLRDRNTSNSIIDSNVNELCAYYKCLKKDQKRDFILELACEYAVHHSDVCKVANSLVSEHCNESQSIRLQEKLKMALTPQYKWLFIHIGRQEHGVKFLVDMRTDLMEILKQINKSEDSSTAYLLQLNNTLRELFLLWFSVGFLKLERMTWKSSCAMLQKISDYEAVHPVRSWTDLKKRMGPDRRCFVYTHTSMPDEPLVILHTALRDEIASSTSGIITQNTNNDEILHNSNTYSPDNVKAAIFYSISSTQIGLQGIELGNYLIKRVATELAKEFPKTHQFSSLSPIPKFKSWLFDVLKCANNDSVFARDVFLNGELDALKNTLKCENVFKELMKQLSSNSWLQTPDLVSMLEPILMRMCIRYLYVEKKRGYALDSVANFHLRNGAEMWRINWMADTSARGLTTSCGIMVNYRYYLDEAENNSKSYIENKEIVISPLVKELLDKNNLG